MSSLLRFITAARTSWIVLVVALGASAALFAVGSGNNEQTAPPVGLPDTAESVQVEKLQEQLPSAEGTSALLVFTREGGTLDDADIAAIAERSAELAELSAEGFVPPPAVSDDSTVALLAVPLDILTDVDVQSERAAEIRDIAGDGLSGIDVVYFRGAEASRLTLAACLSKGADFHAPPQPRPGGRGSAVGDLTAARGSGSYRSRSLGIADGIAGIIERRAVAGSPRHRARRLPSEASCRCSCSGAGTQLRVCSSSRAYSSDDMAI